jgi:hypothetical protein
MTSKTDKETNTGAEKTGAVRGTESYSSKARWEGEHLGCSPCGKLAGREPWFSGWPGPEVLLSLLPKIKEGLYPASAEFQG